MQPLMMRAGLSEHWVIAPPRSRCKVPTRSGSTAATAAAGSVTRRLGGARRKRRANALSSRRVQVELSFGAARRGVASMIIQ